MDKHKSVAIVLDDHHLYADAFSALIERLRLFNRVLTFAEGHELTHFLIQHPDDDVYLFLDFYLKEETALTIITEVKRLNKKAKIIVTSSVTSPAVISHVLDYQPQGMVSKSSDFNTILKCINAVSKGEQFLCPIIREITEKSTKAPKSVFSARELEILKYFASGLSIISTAEKVHLSKHTIVAHRRNMMAKANVNSIIELLSYARQNELI